MKRDVIVEMENTPSPGLYRTPVGAVFVFRITRKGGGSGPETGGYSAYPVNVRGYSGNFILRVRDWKRGSERRGSTPTLTSKPYRFLRVRSLSVDNFLMGCPHCHLR